MQTNAQRKRIQQPSAVSPMTRSKTTSGGGVPNSSMARVQEREQEQIPQAEREADRLSAAVNSGTPDSVKALMGQRMGADFSGVRFHTDSAAAAKADAMGARAYTSGSDVYFGQGGFDASVAAHELVHTAQQGMVDSGVATMSTPVGGVQMKTKKTPQQLETERNKKYNQKLSKLGPEKINAILSGGGKKRDRKEFEKIMGVLNGEGSAYGGQYNFKGELTEDNIRMLYDAGDASRDYITNRVLGNAVSHVKATHEKNNPNGYSNPQGVEHQKYLATLQDNSLRHGSGGALTEFGRMTRALAVPAIADAKQNLVNSSKANPAASAHKSSDEFKQAATTGAQDFLRSLPSQLGDSANDFRSFNGQFLERLTASMPDLFSDEDAARSFVGKSTALRGLFPVLTEGLDMDKDAMALRIGQSGLKAANDMITLANGTGSMNDDVRGIRDALVPSLSRPEPVVGSKTSDETMAYRTTAVPQVYDPSSASEDEALAMMYNRIKNPRPGDSADTLSEYKRQFSQMRAAQMQRQQSASAPAPAPAAQPKKRSLLSRLFRRK